MRKSKLFLLIVAMSIGAIALDPARAEISGLVGYWPLDEGSGNVAEELSGKGNLGQILGDIEWVETERGMALRFDGKTNVRVPDSPAWNIGPGELTFSMWVKLSENNAGDIFEHAFANKPGTWVLHAGNPPIMSFYDDKSVGKDIRFHGFQQGKWQHLALVWRRAGDGSMTSYVNGARAATLTVGVTEKQFGDLYFGSMRGYNYFKGYLKEVAIFNRALSDEEVGTLYRDGVRIEHPAVIYSKTRGNVLAVYRGGVLLRGSSVVSPATGKVLYDRKQDEDSSVGILYDVPPGQRQLFMDDYGVAKIDNLERTMHQPEKRGAVVKPDRPGEMSLQTRCVPAWDQKEKIFKLWMITSTHVAGVAGATYATSTDGVRWTKPMLGQWEFQGSRENNFVAVDPKLQWPDNAIANAVYDPHERNPARRYKGFLGAIDRRPMVSPDGVRWKLLNVPKLPSSDESNLSYDPESRTFIATLKTSGPHGRAHAIWTSRDFQSWTNLKVVFHADDEDQRLAKANVEARLADSTLHPVNVNPAACNADIYNIGIFRYQGLYIGLPAVFHSSGSDGFHLIQLACSRDLRTWQRLGDRKPFIGPSPVGQGAYDLTQLLPPSAPVVHNDELWFYYTGIKYRTAPPNPDPDWGAVCLAVLRRDGFISLDAGEKEGVLVLKPFVLTGGPLHVNVDARGGELRAEVFGEGGTHLVSEPVTGDQPRAEVRWPDGDLAAFQDRVVTLRFTLRQARLYSYWLKK